MPTIIDSLIVLLRLDPQGFNRGNRDVRDGLDRTRSSADRAQRDLDTFAKRSAEGIGKLRNETLGLFLAFQGAWSVRGLITNMVTADAATGRLAGNIGLSVNRLSAWQLAVRAVGGDAKDADAALSAMAAARQSYALTGSTGNDADFKGLGLSLADINGSPEQALLKMAEAAERMDKTEFFARASRIGLPASVINTLEQGRSGVERLVREKERDAAVTQRETDAAQALQGRVAELEAKITGALRPAVYDLVDGLLKLTDNTDAATLAVPILTGLIGAAGIAAAIAYAPFFALAGVIAAAVAQYQLWQRLQDLSPAKRKGLEDRAGAIRQEAWDAFNTKDDISIPERFGRAFGVLSGHIGEGVHALDGAPAGGAGTGGGGAVKDQFTVLERAYGTSRARGIWAGIGAESSWNPGARGPGSAAAYGLGQWVGARKRALFAKYGPNPSAADQIQFLMSELNGGDPGGSSVLGQSSTGGTIIAYLRDFMRPQGAHGEHMADLVSDIGRANSYAGLARPRAPIGGGAGGTTTHSASVGTINVYTAATDANGVAAALPGAIERRGLTNQANRGLD